jgi:diacylglycerol kinase (ATP)
MANASGVRVARIFVILNPSAGSYAPGKVSEALGRHVDFVDGSCEIHEAAGHEDLTALARAAAERGSEIVAAGGGDGTVSAVANGVIGSSAVLGILPLGTGNVVAQELGIPMDLEGACELLFGPHSTARIDAMRLDGRHYYMRVGIGIDALMIRATKREAKRRFGRLAYLWGVCTQLVGFQPRRFNISVDGVPEHFHASEVALVNCGVMGRKPLRWGPNIRPDDGRLNVCIIRARNLIDYLVVAWLFVLGRPRPNRRMTYRIAERAVAIAADIPLVVQADGETVGETPIEVKVIPGAIRVVVPEGGIPAPPI